MKKEVALDLCPSCTLPVPPCSAVSEMCPTCVCPTPSRLSITNRTLPFLSAMCALVWELCALCVWCRLTSMCGYLDADVCQQMCIQPYVYMCVVSYMHACV